MAKPTPAWRRVGLLALLIVALGVRCWRGWSQPVVNCDAIRFVALAQQFWSHPLEALRQEAYHPFHAIAGSFFYHAITRWWIADARLAWLVALQIVGILAGVWLTLQIQLLARRLGASWWAAWSAALLWSLGRRTSGYGADGISDLLALALLTQALLLAMRWRLEFNVPRAMAVGLLAGLSYLTRPEGAMVMLILAGAWGYRLWKIQSPYPWPRIWASLGALTMSFALLALPYMAVIGRFTQKKPILQSSLGGSSPSTAGIYPLGGLFWSHQGRIFREIWETFGFTNCLAVLVAMLLYPRLWGRGHWRWMVCWWAGLWMAVMHWLQNRAGYLDGRHTLIMQVVLWAILGLALDRICGYWPLRRRGLLMSLLVLGLALPGLYRLGRPTYIEKQPMRQAAEWLKTHAQGQAKIWDEEQLIGYYSGLAFGRYQARPESPLPAAILQGPVPIVGYYFRRGEKVAPQGGGLGKLAEFAGSEGVVVLYGSAGALR